MLAVTGYRSKIVEELRKLLPPEEEVARNYNVITDQGIDATVCDRYLFCAGVLRPKTLREQTANEVDESIEANLLRPMRACESILSVNAKARIAVMGSESGFSWSYDGTYAAAKAALHRYVETKKLKPDQQLVCVAPSIIEDCGMTLRREDTENLERRRKAHPKQRFLKAVEIARLIHFLLYVDQGYISNTVIRVNGGGS
jgi:NAD(P)-dependent dehydrogenase (short-subunit alcohol dehydrogenase family)